MNLVLWKKILLLLAGFLGLAACAPRCYATNFCMACSETIQNQCEACFNKNNSTIGPRMLETAVSPHHCRNIVSASLAVANCKRYSGKIISGPLGKTYNTCEVCNTKF
jgi:hypothetical protein